MIDLGGGGDDPVFLKTRTAHRFFGQHLFAQLVPATAVSALVPALAAVVPRFS